MKNSFFLLVCALLIKMRILQFGAHAMQPSFPSSLHLKMGEFRLLKHIPPCAVESGNSKDNRKNARVPTRIQVNTCCACAIHTVVFVL